MNKGIFYAVGTGAGNPMDITLRAKQILEKADVILIPVKSADDESVAFQIACHTVDMSRSEKIRMVFPMKLSDDYKKYLSDDIMLSVRRKLDKGKNIAMLTLGDVSVYSTANYVRQILESEGYNTETISGIPSFITAADRAGISLCENQESFSVLSGISSMESLQNAVESFDTVVIMKAGKSLHWLIPFLKKRGLDNNTLMFCNLGMKDEYIGALKEDCTGYFTTVIIKKGGLK